MAKIYNLLSFPITVIDDGDHPIATFEPYTDQAFFPLTAHYAVERWVRVNDKNIPVFRRDWSPAGELPPQQPDVYYIVPESVAEACANRRPDFLTVMDPVPNQPQHAFAVRGFLTIGELCSSQRR